MSTYTITNVNDITSNIVTADSHFIGPRLMGITTIAEADSTYTVLSTDEVILVETTAEDSGPITLNLPDASTLEAGRTYIVKDAGGNAGTYGINIVPNGLGQIDGVNSTVSISTNNGSIMLMGDASDWWILAQKSI